MAVVIERHRARGGAIEPGDGAQQRRLAAAGAADDGDDLAELDLGGKALQRMHAVGIGLADAIEREHQAAPPCRPNASCQRKQRRGRDLDQPVGGLAEDGEDHDRGDDLRGLAELLAVDQEIAEAFGRAHEFGGDHEHPAQAKPDAQRHHIGRQHGRQAGCGGSSPDRRGGRCGRPRRSCGRPTGSRPSRRDRPERTRRPRSARSSRSRKCRARG